MINTFLFPTKIALLMHFRGYYAIDIFFAFILSLICAALHAYFENLLIGGSHALILVYPVFAVISLAFLFPMMVIVALYIEIMWNLFGITKLFGLRDGALRNKLIGWINKRK